ncbi:wd domain-containing protein [Moniliophthora roreri]|uniref:Putative WD40 repeat-like protein n=1 Tax=Moniliophthora roreri TaxID=221103 RepID=A0A0W0EUB1_MONRR|nr:wd domain-containing protein [Moniliophthora roreri]
MRFSQSDQESNLSTSPDLASPALAGPSFKGLDSPSASTSNGHTSSASIFSNGNGFVSGVSAQNGLANGTSASGSGVSGVSNGIGMSAHKHGKNPVARVNLPGDMLYADANVNREEFVRLLVQSLKEVGYMETAATLEAESGYMMEAPEVRNFREFILDGMWGKAEAALMRLGAMDEQTLLEIKFVISKQKYLELLEARKTTSALHVLRNELAPLSVDTDLLHSLSSLIMCSDPEDVRQRAGWDGASGLSRRQLLNELHRYIPPSVMIPQRRFLTLLQQAHSYQLQRCIYHNQPASVTPFSLYSDHQCDKAQFPRITTNILTGHTDEVWNLEWSHDGRYLASASKDKTAIIWQINESGDWEDYKLLRDHPYAVGCLAWSLDDKILLTSSENFIKLWVTSTGVCTRTLDEHTETVTALSWLPDGSGFLSAALDRKIIQWGTDGSKHSSWGPTAIRITDLTVTPDLTRVVTIGMNPGIIEAAPTNRGTTGRNNGNPGGTPPGGGAAANGVKNGNENRMVIYNYPSRQVESSIRLDGELTSVKISQDNHFALINHAPDEIHLWDLQQGRLARKFTGQKQGRHVIRSCFGGTDGNFVVSGSEDGNVYVWHRDTGTLLEVLPDHGEGSVNSVSWNPRNGRMFASCSDDHTIRIWEAPLPVPGYHSSFSAHPESPSSSSLNWKGKGKTRQAWDSDGSREVQDLDQLGSARL